MKPASLPSSIEPLEHRIAPAAVVNYVDIDGDKVTISDSSGTLAEANLTIVNGQLQLLDLTAEGFQGANILFKVSKVAGGDGLADVGFINATGRDLGMVAIKGDLGRIDAGDADATTAAIKALTATSFGRQGLASQGAGASIESLVIGDIGKLTIKTDFTGVWLHLTAGGIGSVKIGGSLVGTTEANGGKIEVSESIGLVKIGRDLVGSSGAFAGHISAENLGNVTLGGDLIGGTGGFTGMIYGNASVGAVKIGGSVIGDGTTTGGGLGDNGLIQSGFGDLKSVTIGGSLIGGRGDFSGSIAFATGMGSSGTLGFVKIGGDMVGGTGGNSGTIFGTGVLGPVTVGGGNFGGAGNQSGSLLVFGTITAVKIGEDLRGGSGIFSGLLNSIGGAIGKVTIGGSLVGGSTSLTGGILSNGTLGVVSIKGSLVGGDIIGTAPSADSTGWIESAGDIAGISIGGSIIAGTDTSTVGNLFKSGSIRSGGSIESLTVKGSVIGNETADGDSPAIISARGQAITMNDHNVAIGKISIGGSVQKALILAGYHQGVIGANTSLAAVSGDAEIGAVMVGGDWVASSLVAGAVDTDNDGFGDADDAPIGVAAAGRIASILIKGSLFGSAEAGDRFGFVAPSIGLFKASSYKAPLTAAPDEFLERALLTGDVTIREV